MFFQNRYLHNIFWYTINNVDFKEQSTFLIYEGQNVLNLVIIVNKHLQWRGPVTSAYSCFR
jgi:hypothetical protein